MRRQDTTRQAAEPPVPGTEPFQKYWEEELACPDKDCRLHSVERLTALGAEGEPFLISLLRDKESDVRIAAAHALGQVGGEQGLGALLEALRSSFVGGSSRRQRNLGLLLIAATLVVLVVRWFVQPGRQNLVTWFLVPAMLPIAQSVTIHYLGAVRRRSSFVRALAEAILHFGERHPSPRLASVVEDLKGAASDVLQQDKETRKTSREVAERLEGLTRQIKDLPVASGPRCDEKALPRPAVEPGLDVEALPRVRS